MAKIFHYSVKSLPKRTSSNNSYIGSNTQQLPPNMSVATVSSRQTAHTVDLLGASIEQMPIGHNKTSTMCSATSRTHVPFPSSRSTLAQVAQTKRLVLGRQEYAPICRLHLHHKISLFISWTQLHGP